MDILAKKILLILLVLCTFCSCLKDGKRCKELTEITGTDHLVDITPVLNIPELKARLQKYPQLQVFRVIDNEYEIAFISNVFYRGMPIIFESYRMSKSKKFHNIICTSEAPPDTIPISLKPLVSVPDAIKIAKGQQNFTDRCIAFRLGIFDINAGSGSSQKNYRLVWKIEGLEQEVPMVIIDATTKEVIMSDNGIGQ
jgi:hypothetical protein